MAGEKWHRIRHALWAVPALVGLTVLWVKFQQPRVYTGSATTAHRDGSVLSRRSGNLVALPGAPQSQPSLPTATAEPATPAEPTPVPPRSEVIVYKVKAGDTVWGIAKAFNIDDDTIIWANASLEKDPDWLSIGEDLYILPVVGVWHTVKQGDTPASLAQYYQVDPQDILSYEPNRLSAGADLPVGRQLIIPGGVKPFVPRTVNTGSGVVTISREAGGGFIWPCNGTVTTEYGPDHRAIDIGINIDTPLYASAAGVVTQSGPNGTLGLSVIIDHGNGYITVYGHMDYLWVRPGQNVRQGQKLGAVGSTGKSTGPHVHFIILHGGTPVDPLSLLPH